MELRITNNAVEISGYVNAVERDSRVLYDRNGKFVERVASGCFRKALNSGYPVGLYFNHIRSIDSTDGNLILDEDSIGLRAECIVTDEEIVRAAKEDKMTGWSFAFRPIRDRWETDSDGLRHRTLEELELIEVSILTEMPAYIATSISARSEKITEYSYNNDGLEIRKIVDNVPVAEEQDDSNPVEEQENEVVERNYDYIEKLIKIWE